MGPGSNDKFKTESDLVWLLGTWVSCWGSFNALRHWDIHFLYSKTYIHYRLVSKVGTQRRSLQVLYSWTVGVAGIWRFPIISHYELFMLQLVKHPILFSLHTNSHTQYSASVPLTVYLAICEYSYRFFFLQLRRLKKLFVITITKEVNVFCSILGRESKNRHVGGSNSLKNTWIWEGKRKGLLYDIKKLRRNKKRHPETCRTSRMSPPSSNTIERFLRRPVPPNLPSEVQTCHRSDALRGR